MTMTDQNNMKMQLCSSMTLDLDACGQSIEIILVLIEEFHYLRNTLSSVAASNGTEEVLVTYFLTGTFALRRHNIKNSLI